MRTQPPFPAHLLGLGFAAALLSCLLGCDELRNPPPAAPGPVAPPAPSRFNIVGHWEAQTTQGRRIAFDVTADGRVVGGRINLHHDCNTGRWRATFDGFQAPIVDDAFFATLTWQSSDDGLTRTGTATISGRFEGDTVARGGFINTVTDVRKQGKPTGELCPAVQGGWTGEKE